jgi:hypothetical protein
VYIRVRVLAIVHARRVIVTKSVIVHRSQFDCVDN